MVSPTPFRAAEFRSAYGPKYQFQPHLGGITLKTFTRYSAKSAAFGGFLGVAALFYTSGIPRIQTDILQKVPFIGSYFVKEIHPADNPF
ncbi:ubiquinol-cytochrome c reductase subunit 10 [Geosmithia morbida]|uniref:Ubiquinol-cytochrome c reductase subunit 10 n=1 Tax=Geosmithia morbida TaxID=1094350 RepID=A0A9P4Z1L7_9HYPO|nr:ubiquinol-cytochrome c reductase subunit 10 [Geosmithia morbida]KAF4126915.1 ubiquinol-cytochrome c reductase subunit 10 [Geosmithia morbida]